MHENKFERDVQDKLGGMRMAPSAPVWAAVEARIREERRKRRLLLFWLLFPLLLLGGGAAWWLGARPGSTPAPVASGHTAYPNDPSSTSGKTIPFAQQAPSVMQQRPALDTTTTTASPTTGRSTAPVAIGTPRRQPPAKPARNRQGAASDYRLYLEPGDPVSAEVQQRTEREVLARLFGKKRKSNSGTTAGGTIATAPGAVADTRPKENPLPGTRASTDSTQTKTVVQSTPNNKPAPDSSLSHTAASGLPKAHRKRLQWALEGGLGAALPLQTGGMQSIAYSGTGYTQWRSGYSFALGARLLLPLAPDLRFSTGLDAGLLHLGTQTTGTMGALSTSGFPLSGFSTGDSDKTTAHDNLLYLQLPLNLEWTPAPRLPLSLHGGFALSHFVSALPDGAAATQYWLQAGARYRLGRGSKHSLELGPQLQYGLRRFSGNHRLLQAGATLRFSF